MKRIAYILLALSLELTAIGPASGTPTATPPDEVFAGYKLIEQWRVEEAGTLAEKLLDKYPESGDAHFLNARVEFLRGNYEYARKILTRVGGNHAPVREFKKLVQDTHDATKLFISRESEHFIFHFEQGPDEILVHYAEEVLEKSYEVLGKLLNYYPQQRVLVEFYPDRKPFSRISPLTLQDILTSGTVPFGTASYCLLISP